MTRSRAAAPLALLLLLIAPRPGRSAAQEVLAVLSSGPGPYQAAFDGFVKAFGGEATVQSYPESATLIACLAPGLSARLRHSGPLSLVTMKPAPERLLSELRRLQPGLKRLAVLSHARDTEAYLADLRRAASALDVEIVAPRLSGPDGLPDALRSVSGKVDALWLAPDPSLVTPGSFETIKQFSWNNGVPFYAPTRGLAAAGAAAAVSVSAEEAGRQAAELARRALAGETLPELVYPARTELTVNQTSALKAGLSIRPEALGKDVEVIR